MQQSAQGVSTRPRRSNQLNKSRPRAALPDLPLDDHAGAHGHVLAVKDVDANDPDVVQPHDAGRGVDLPVVEAYRLLGDELDLTRL